MERRGVTRSGGLNNSLVLEFPLSTSVDKAVNNHKSLNI